MKKFLFIFSSLFISQNAFANQPVDWQLGFQKAASESMREIVACLLYTSDAADE